MMTAESPQGGSGNEIVLTRHHSIIGPVGSIGVVIPLITLALKDRVKDPSSYVKRAAATSIPKVFQ